MTVKCTPKKKNKKHLYITLAFSIGMLLCIVMMILGLGNKLAFQTLTVAFAVSALWCATKFFFTQVTYTLTDHYGGKMMLIITQMQGKRMTTAFESKMSKIIGIGKISGGEQTPLPSGTVYDFRVTLGVGEFQYVQTRIAGKDVVVKLEADDEFWNEFVLAYQHSLADRESVLDDGSDEEEDD